MNLRIPQNKTKFFVRHVVSLFVICKFHIIPWKDEFSHTSSILPRLLYDFRTSYGKKNVFTVLFSKEYC